MIYKYTNHSHFFTYILVCVVHICIHIYMHTYIWIYCLTHIKAQTHTKQLSAKEKTLEVLWAVRVGREDSFKDSKKKNVIEDKATSYFSSPFPRESTPTGYPIQNSHLWNNTYTSKWHYTNLAECILGIYLSIHTFV